MLQSLAMLKENVEGCTSRYCHGGSRQSEAPCSDYMFRGSDGVRWGQIVKGVKETMDAATGRE